jgi:SRSO17 transposase
VIDETSCAQARQKVGRGGPAALRHDRPPGKLEGAECSSLTPARKVTPSQDPELYLPMRWIKDRKRCQEAGIPEAIRFQTKCEQARQMIERLWLAKIPFAWVVADTVYGGNEELRTWLEAHGYSFVLAVACDEPVEIQTPEGLKRMTVAEAEASFCREEDWQRLSRSSGDQGATAV